MTLVVCSIYDEVADFYSPPFCCKTVNEGARLFKDSIEGGKSQLSEHPQDYKLYRIGSFDDSTGLFVSVEPQFISRGGVTPENL